jgi:hypothetical protein
MRTNITKHGLSVLITAAFISLALGSATTPNTRREPVYTYTEIPFDQLLAKEGTVIEPGTGFIVDAYLYRHTDSIFSITPVMYPPEQDWDAVQNSAVYCHWMDDIQDRYEPSKQYKVSIVLDDVVQGGDRVWKRDGNRLRARATKVEGLLSWGEVVHIKAKEKAEAEAKEKAEREAKEKAEAEAREAARKAAEEAKRNPHNLDRSLYKEITVEDFSFDMVAGNLAVGSKVCFRAKFFTKPTGPTYRFDDIDRAITLSSSHNFVRDIPERFFDWQHFVKIFVTVTKTGQTGTCSVDIVEW